MTVSWGSIAIAQDQAKDGPPEFVISTQTPAKNHKPWRMYEAIDSPPWLFFSGVQRTRFEQVLNQFRVGRSGNDRVLAMRTNLVAKLRLKHVTFGVELSDARAYLSDANTPIDSGVVNTLALLRAYLAFELENAGLPGASAHFRMGRLTIDLGSRRLVARNRFRNTINGFTGFDFAWKSGGGMEIRGFAALPVRRRPEDEVEARDNTIRFDREDFSTVTWALFFASRPILNDIVFEGYLIGLHEQDTPSYATRNRTLATPGFRIFRPPRPGGVDFQVELAAQLGQSRQTTRAEDRADLQHRAFFQHTSVGYTWEAPFDPRFALHYDFASGDQDPGDDVNGRFDTLFGARRFEFGPTGIYGAFARSNLHSPGARVELKPLPEVSLVGAYRAFWLASSRDAWTTAGLRDESGTSGSFLGHQVEARAVFDVFVGNLKLETGIAHTARGRFARDAPDANEGGNPTVVYAQWILTF